MASLRELIYNLKNIVRNGVQGQDEPISDRQMAFIINYIRSYLVNKAFETKKTLYTSWQEIPCIEMELVDSSECCHFETGCFILRTKNPIPTPINGLNGLAYFGLIDKKRGYAIHTNVQARYIKYSRYVTKPEIAYWFNDRLYIEHNPFIEVMTMVGLFAEPYKALTLNSCESNCINLDDLYSYWDLEYPIDSYMILELNRLILDKELRILALSKFDPKNDSRQDSREQSITP